MSETAGGAPLAREGMDLLGLHQVPAGAPLGDCAVVLIDLDGKVRTWNECAARLHGYDGQEIIGQPFSRLYSEDDRQKQFPQQDLGNAARDGRFASEGWRIRKDGSRFWASAQLDAMRDDQGQLAGYVNVTRDMTGLEREHRKILESELRYRHLLESVVDYAIFQLDAEGLVTTWNSGARRIKGYTADEIIGKHFSAFYTEEDRAAGIPAKALETAGREGRYEAEGWRVRKDGSRFFASVVIDRIVDDDGQLIGFAKVTRDITEKHQAQQRLKETQEQLASAQKMEAIGQLSGGIAHDFNNLLMIVLGNLETAQRNVRKIGNEQLQRTLANASRGAQRAAALTSRLLAFSRRQALDPKPMDVNKFLSGAVEFLSRSLGETIEIETVGSAGLWPIEADPNQLESALVNLAINARDAMPKGGKLTIEAANTFVDLDYARVNPEISAGQYVVIAVTDTGTGMSPEIQSHAFEPFFTTKEIGHGTGLGLSQVYGFVKQSGGHVKIYSEVGEGTTIKMYFPRLLGMHATEGESAEPAVVPADIGETILVVEDDEGVRSYLAETLRSLNYTVLTAANAQAALTVLVQDNKRVDLLLTDIVMPGLTGRELGIKARAFRPDLPILYMTGYSRNAVVHQGRIDPGVDLLQKPVRQADLAQRIRDILDRERGSDPR